MVMPCLRGRLMPLLACLFVAAQAAPAEQLTLEEAIRTALDRNPALQAARADSAASEAHAIGARARTNPELVVAPGIAGPAGSDEELSVSQSLETNGARQARTRIAGAEFDASRANAAVVEREVVRDVKQAYWDIALAQSTVELNKDNVTLAESLYAAAKRQVEVGTAPGSHGIKTEVELARSRQELLRAETELTQAKAVLNSVLGREPDTSFDLAEKLTYSPAAVDAGALRASALANRPELREAAAKIESRRGEVDAARSLGKPDVAVQGRMDKLDGSGGVAIAATLPIWDWGRPAPGASSGPGFCQS